MTQTEWENGAMALILAVTGVSPGIGKSTLCAALAARYESRGKRVDHFREEEILSRREFAELATEFHETRRVRPETILAAMREFADSFSETDVVIADALLPFVPSLNAWGHSEAEMAEFLDKLSAVLASHRTVVIYLDGDPETALPRAIAREEPGWLDGVVAKLADRGVTDRKSARTYLRNERGLTLRLLQDLPWRIVVAQSVFLG